MTEIIEELWQFGQRLENQFSLISDERKSLLNKLSTHLFHKFNKKESPKLIVICTHNSRRSHIGQLMLALGAEYYGLPSMGTFSGGTEATAFNPRAIRAIKEIGFKVLCEDEKVENPVYQITWLENGTAYQAFSKRYDVSPNPQEDFGAILVCSEADEACPVVLGSDFRLALPYKDPKAFDDTDLESEKYRNKCFEIGREMFYVLQQVKRSLELEALGGVEG